MRHVAVKTVAGEVEHNVRLDAVLVIDRFVIYDDAACASLCEKRGDAVLFSRGQHLCCRGDRDDLADQAEAIRVDHVTSGANGQRAASFDVYVAEKDALAGADDQGRTVCNGVRERLHHVAALRQYVRRAETIGVNGKIGASRAANAVAVKLRQVFDFADVVVRRRRSGASLIGVNPNCHYKSPTAWKLIKPPSVPLLMIDEGRFLDMTRYVTLWLSVSTPPVSM